MLNHMSTGQRVEWGLASARAQRWVEEVNILREEMRRTQRFYWHRISHWESRRDNIENKFGLGFSAHAARQVHDLITAKLIESTVALHIITSCYLMRSKDWIRYWSPTDGPSIRSWLQRERTKHRTSISKSKTETRPRCRRIFSATRWDQQRATGAPIFGKFNAAAP